VSLYLALDTATAHASVAAGDEGGAFAEATVGRLRHAAATLPAMEEVLRLAGAAFADVAGIVVADGPGSFTGLRIGFATAKGVWHARPAMSFATAPSLMAAAWGAAALAAGPVAAVYDALRGEVFVAVYRFDKEGAATLVAPRLVGAADLPKVRPAPAVAVGDGAAAHADAVLAWTGRPPIGPPGGAPRAGALLELLRMPGAVTGVEDPTVLEPHYGRLAEAQVRWERTHGRALPDSSSRGG
jgi:tRNA threonylcarbamoyladenosine biosynthesis protein TsaB